MYVPQRRAAPTSLAPFSTARKSQRGVSKETVVQCASAVDRPASCAGIANQRVNGYSPAGVNKSQI